MMKVSLPPLLQYPLTLVLTLTIPVVDIDEPMNNWNKWLTVIQCVVSPLFISLVAECKDMHSILYVL